MLFEVMFIMTGIIKLNQDLLRYDLGQYQDFNSIPLTTCYGIWWGSQGVGSKPASVDGWYFKIGDIIVALDGWNKRYYIKGNWGGWGGWVQV